MQEAIVVRGARQHNLKNVDVTIPRGQMVVITGPSGSGKSSLAFDTIYAEGQRRYVESLSAYARQFLGQMDKPEVDSIDGLSPAISIDQKSTSHNPRSTVGTVTEIHDYLRLLYARVGEPHCPGCGRPIRQQTVQQMVDAITAWEEGSRLLVLAPLVRGRKGTHQKLLERIAREGFVRVRVNGEIQEIGEMEPLDGRRSHRIEAVVDRLVLRPGGERRLADSLETALRLGEGLVIIQKVEGEEVLFSQHLACPDCGISLPELSPRSFSFNSPFGACPTCTGLGEVYTFDPHRVILESRPVAEGAVVPLFQSPYYQMLLEQVVRHLGADPAVPYRRLPESVQRALWEGIEEPVSLHLRHGRRETHFPGIVAILRRRLAEASDREREELASFQTAHPCPDCLGARLGPASRAVTVGGEPIHRVSALTVADALVFFRDLALPPQEERIAREVVKEIGGRLGFLERVGLGYLTLDRPANTLSGGEAQRIRLATQIGSGLTGVLYILDEPSIGLHPRDNDSLIATLKRLRDLGNTVIVVEHDEETWRSADFLIDIGPGAGEHGGRVMAAGTVEEVARSPQSITGHFLSGRRQIETPAVRRQGTGRSLDLTGVTAHNLQGVSVRLPLGLLIAVTGVSGSGKSTLVGALAHFLGAGSLRRMPPEVGGRVRGEEHLARTPMVVDQAPIGRTPRSNPATYIGLFDLIRQLYSETPEARLRGYGPGRFSFNVRGGRCEACRGDGILKIEMHFLPDVYVPCEVCKGSRYNRETLEVQVKGKTVAEVLAMTVDEALEFFTAHPRIRQKLESLRDVGLGYMRLGQSATTLSGGEAQRLKLAVELGKRARGHGLYILDEPTTGLHPVDVERLLQVLQRLVEQDNTVVVIEHNLDMIKSADYVIDMGPEGGKGGGRVVTTGTPEEVAAVSTSHTGRYLRDLLHPRWQAAEV